MTEKRKDYILELRNYVGHRPLILVGAAVLIFNQKDELLLGLRPDNHCWGIPGGGMEPGELLEETARRESREETGLEVGALDLFGVFSGPTLFYEYPNGDQVYNVTVVYQTHDFQGHLLDCSAEVDEQRFFALDQLPENLSPPIRPVLEQLLATQERA